MSEKRLKWFNQKHAKYGCLLRSSQYRVEAKKVHKEKSSFQHHVRKNLSLQVFMAAYKNIDW